MAGNEDDYREIEAELDEEFSQLRGSGQQHRIWSGLANLIRERSLLENLTPEQYRLRLSQAGTFLDDLRLGLSSHQGEDAETPEIWFHRSVERVTGAEKNSKESIDGRSLQMATAYYLARPWMQHNQIDWILLDALVYGELVACREYVLSGEAIGKVNWAYALAEGKLEKAIWMRLLMDLSIWAMRYVVPPVVIAALLLLGYQTPAIGAAGLYVVYLTGRFVFWPRRYRRKKNRRQELKRWQDRWTQMTVAYTLCEPPVISPTILREQISKPTEIGPLFSGAVFAVLDRIIARDRDVFLPLESPWA